MPIRTVSVTDPSPSTTPWSAIAGVGVADRCQAVAAVSSPVVPGSTSLRSVRTVSGGVSVVVVQSAAAVHEPTPSSGVATLTSDSPQAPSATVTVYVASAVPPGSTGPVTFQTRNGCAGSVSSRARPWAASAAVSRVPCSRTSLMSSWTTTSVSSAWLSLRRCSV